MRRRSQTTTNHQPAISHRSRMKRKRKRSGLVALRGAHAPGSQQASKKERKQKKDERKKTEKTKDAQKDPTDLQ